MAGKKGMKMTNLTPQDIERRKGNFAVSQEDVAKAAIPAPSIEKIHKFLRVGAGQPPCFETEEQLQAEIEDYFKSCLAFECDENGVVISGRWVKKPTLSGMAIHLGVARETIWNYSKSDRYFHTIKRAKDIITNFTEELLIEGKNPVGAINTLVNLRVGWVADEKTIKVEPVMPDNGAKSTDEITAFLDNKALPEFTED
jgi:hypothetical protein